jgi:hypothetical protein
MPANAWGLGDPETRREERLDRFQLPFLRLAEALRGDWRKVGVRADHPTSREGGG